MIRCFKKFNKMRSRLTLKIHIPDERTFKYEIVYQLQFYFLSFIYSVIYSAVHLLFKRNSV